MQRHKVGRDDSFLDDIIPILKKLNMIVSITQPTLKYSNYSTVQFKKLFVPSVVIYMCIPSTQEAESRRITSLRPAWDTQ
jgi:hypothetical protein